MLSECGPEEDNAGDDGRSGVDRPETKGEEERDIESQGNKLEIKEETLGARAGGALTMSYGGRHLQQ